MQIIVKQSEEIHDDLDGLSEIVSSLNSSLEESQNDEIFRSSGKQIKSDVYKNQTFFLFLSYRVDFLLYNSEVRHKELPVDKIG